jgi:transcriptional regulator with XRE-family HTH domain
MAAQEAVVDEKPSSYPFGVMIRRIREGAKLSQNELQRKLEQVGYMVDTSSLSKYEAGIRKPSAEFIPFFAKAVGLSDKDEEVIFLAYVEDYRLSARYEYLQAKQRLNKGG